MTPEEWDDAVAAYDDRDPLDGWPTNERPPATVTVHWLLCGIGGCVLSKDHPGAPDYGHVGRSCGHIQCADEHGHIDTCLIEGNEP